MIASQFHIRTSEILRGTRPIVSTAEAPANSTTYSIANFASACTLKRRHDRSPCGRSMVSSSLALRMQCIIEKDSSGHGDRCLNQSTIYNGRCNRMYIDAPTTTASGNTSINVKHWPRRIEIKPRREVTHRAWGGQVSQTEP
jgi:hypothetical protein